MFAEGVEVCAGIVGSPFGGIGEEAAAITTNTRSYRSEGVRTGLRTRGPVVEYAAPDVIESYGGVLE